jgi:hypothetical protein
MVFFQKRNVDTFNGDQGTHRIQTFFNWQKQQDLGENVHGNETMKVASTHISNLASQKVKT